ncbi:ER membrane protein complex subunit 4 [Ceratocystis platani]|uniref:ER membrane protein complex subunit 4 n=1 Tax=Ceratocystis fimbriata f. sp. platani TaxID=88771 RepID=A0A0F8B515_CERFI|nr:ER membrane protein complex subunit 4 [Ceratocystis platani]
MKAPGQSLAPSWVSDLQSPPPARSKSTNIADPPLYPSQALTSSKRHKEPKLAPREQPTPEQMDALKLKKAWEVSLSPVKGLPMTAIMMYMSGNSLQIFSIMMVVMAFKNPLVGLLNTNQALDRFATERNSGSILQVKLVYVVCQLVALAVGIWKVNSMGLLPLLKGLEAPQTKRYQLKIDDVDAFIREAYRVNALILDLHSELKDVRKAYLSTAPQRKSHLRIAQPTRERVMTDREREDIDANAKQMIRELNASIRALDDAEQLRRETLAAVHTKRFSGGGIGLGALGSWAAGGLVSRTVKSSEQVQAEEAAAQTTLHRDGVLWLLRRRLELCCATQQHMMETRLTRELEKNKSVLARSAVGSVPLPGVQPGTTKQRIAANGLPPDDKLTGTSTSEARFDSNGMELTQEQVQMFEQGNRAMMEHYENALDKVRERRWR